jgi:hypothetical protein
VSGRCAISDLKFEIVLRNPEPDILTPSS